MPIYEYECRKCSHKFELRRSFTDRDSEIKCPECGEPNPKRIFSIFGTSNSGSGCSSDSYGDST